MSIDIANLLQTHGPVVLMVDDHRKIEAAVQLALKHRPNSAVLSQLALPIHFFNYFRAQTKLQRDVIIRLDELKESCCSWPVTYQMLESMMACKQTAWPSNDEHIVPFTYTGRLTIIATSPDKLTTFMKGEL